MTPLRTLALGMMTMSVLLACTDEQKRDIEGGAIEARIEETTSDALAERDIAVDGEIDCRADVADDGTVSGSCSGTDTDGTDFGTALDGTVDVDEATCSATLTVTWVEEALLVDEEYDCIGS